MTKDPKQPEKDEYSNDDKPMVSLAAKKTF